MRIEFVIDMSGLKTGSPRTIALVSKKLLWLFEGLVKCDQLYLDRHPNTPPLYSADVRYNEEWTSGQEKWKEIPFCLKSGKGDCEDLAAWLCAEFRNQGVPAKGWLKWFHNPDSEITQYHFQVMLPDGNILDPSRELGMKGDY